MLNEHHDEPEQNDFHFEDYDIDYGDDMDPFAIDENEAHLEEESNDHGEVESTLEEHVEEDFLASLSKNGERELFDYFDTAMNSNWAGPDHWKLRRPRTVTVEKRK